MAVSLVVWQGARTAGPGSRAGRVGDTAHIDHQTITAEQFNHAEQEARLEVFTEIRPGQWPGEADTEALRMFTYRWLMLIHEQEQLGIHVGPEQAGQLGHNVLQFGARQLSERRLRSAAARRLPEVPERPETHFNQPTSKAFAAIAWAGRSCWPSPAWRGSSLPRRQPRPIWVRLNQPVATEAVFFSASNYLANVAAPPEAVAGYFTNHQGELQHPEARSGSLRKVQCDEFP